MRIISKFKDYYDGAQGYGIDKSLVYVRKPQELRCESIREFNHAIPKKLRTGRKYVMPSWIDGQKDDSNRISHVWKSCLAFCGKTYPFLQVLTHDKKWHGNILGDRRTVRYIYSVSDWVDLLEQYPYDKRHWETRASKAKHFNYYGLDVDGFFSTAGTDTVPEHIDVGAPIMANYIVADEYGPRYRKYVINPCLKDIEFYHVFDAYSTFQELSMFIGGVMPQEDPAMANISDKDLRDAKGFDKWSFKKLPTKNKRHT